MKLQKYYKPLFTVSIALAVVGAILVAVFGLRLGVDFKGGTATEIEFKQNFDQNAVREVLAVSNLKSFQVQSTGERGLIIKTEALDRSQHEAIFKDISTKVGEFEEKKFDSIGPVVGSELKKSAFYQLGLVSLGIILYIAYAFRKVTRPISPWQFGVAAILALLHDLIIVLAVFAVLGKFWSVEVDSLFVTAVLTVLGFSVHDTIIVFDRIRENIKVYAGQPLQFIVDHSISQTIVRSLNTSLTVLFVLLALLLFGGETIKYFVLALFIGILAGTYSSIFVASPIIVFWQNFSQKKRK
jgi:preprotein translocase subunit SecF